MLSRFRRGRQGLDEETLLLQKAARRKTFRYVTSGLLIALAGIIVIIFGFSLRLGAYSVEGLIIGIGAIVVIIGAVRILIGLINPSTPAELRYVVRPEDIVPEDTTNNDRPIPLDKLTYQNPPIESDNV